MFHALHASMPPGIINMDVGSLCLMHYVRICILCSNAIIKAKAGWSIHSLSSETLWWDSIWSWRRPLSQSYLCNFLSYTSSVEAWWDVFVPANRSNLALWRTVYQFVFSELLHLILGMHRRGLCFVMGMGDLQFLLDWNPNLQSAQNINKLIASAHVWLG